MERRKRLILKILNVVLILLLIVFFLPSLNTIISFPLKFYHTVGTSMLPAIKENDMLLVKKIDNNEMKVGDIIIFSTEKNKGIIYRIMRGEEISHRVIEVAKEPRLMFLIKGDNNEMADGWIGADYVNGRVIWIIPTRFIISTIPLSVLGILCQVLCLVGPIIFKSANIDSNIFSTTTKNLLTCISIYCIFRLIVISRYYV